MIKKTFSDLKIGDEIYFVNFCVNGVPKLESEKICEITHKVKTSTIKLNERVFRKVNSKETTHISLNYIGGIGCFMSPNKNEVIRKYKSYLENSIKDYKNEIKKIQGHIEEYEEQLNKIDN